MSYTRAFTIEGYFFIVSLLAGRWAQSGWPSLNISHVAVARPDVAPSRIPIAVISTSFWFLDTVKINR